MEEEEEGQTSGKSVFCISEQRERVLVLVGIFWIHRGKVSVIYQMFMEFLGKGEKKRLALLSVHCYFLLCECKGTGIVKSLSQVFVLQQQKEFKGPKI